MNFMWLSEMNSLKRLYNAAVVPVVVLDDAADAVPTAKALLAGGVDVMEITFRTAAAADSITAVAKECPDMFVGAGTVITLEQCKKAVACGAKFIVSPGYSEEVVSWCVENGVAVTPGCVTPTEIMAAMSLGLKVVKFFPASVYGGLSAMKALSGPFGGIKFIPTGGVNGKNLGEYHRRAVHPCRRRQLGVRRRRTSPRATSTRSRASARRRARAALGFEVAHVGVNCRRRGGVPCGVPRRSNAAFELRREGGQQLRRSLGSGVEVMKSPVPGQKRPHCGHAPTPCGAARRRSLPRRALRIDESPRPSTAARRMVSGHTSKQEFGGFAVHLLQK